jgi:nicotinic acid phosphoribosyltransferase
MTNFTSTRAVEQPTMHIACNCTACNGKVALITRSKYEGITDTMRHNYVQAAHTMAAPIAARMGVVKVVR